VRHRPETTLLYQIVQEYWPEFQAELASHGKCLPAYVSKEFDEYLKCGRLENGFLRVRCDSCHIARRVGRYLEHQGLLERDTAQPYLTSEALGGDDDTPMHQLLGSSITYRIAVGPQKGNNVFTLQTLPDYGDEPLTTRVGNVAGFSLHAGVATRAHERDKLERLCRYITRPAVATKRLSMTRHGQVRYQLKTPWRNGTTHVVFEPLDFMSRLVSLVPKPRVNLTRFHGVFAPNSKYRAKVTPARRGKRKRSHSADEADQTPAEKRASMTWAQWLKRVFSIDIETCDECGGDVRIIASIEDPAVIRAILAHLDKKGVIAADSLLPDCRASPGPSMDLLI